MILVSDHACSSKWWWIGAIRKTRLRNAWKENTWISTDSASITKMPPITISSTSVFVITASAAIAPSQAERPRVAHEDRRREGVEPEEADAGADQAGRDEREVRLARRERDRDVREQDDRGAAGREAVEPVGEVHRGRRARDYKVDQHRIEVAEVDDRVDDAQVERVGQVGPARRDEPQRDRDRHRDQQLPAPAHAERAPLDELHVVVGEAERGACERDSHHADRARVEVGQQQERDRDRGEDDDPAHRRRAGLGVVLLRAFLADPLAELAPAQELDELGREEDADQQRRRPADEDLAHQRFSSSAASAWATTSRPTPRDALTSTTSPGSTSARASSAAAAASATACASPS